MKRLELVLSLTLVVTLAPAAVPAAVNTYNLNSEVKILASSATPVPLGVHSGPIVMAAGESRYLYGRILGYNPFTPNVLQDVGVDCDPNASRTIPASNIMFTGRNNQGVDFNYPTGAGRLIMYVRSLFTAPATGTYDCALWGVAASSAWDPATQKPYLRILPKDAASVQQSYLQVSSAPDIGAVKWGTPACGSKGLEPTCIYLTQGQSRNDILYYASWYANAAARQATFYVDLEVTTCHTGTASCTVTGGPEYTIVDSRLEVYQLDSTGHNAGCSTGQSYDPFPSTNPKISNDAHHFKIYHQLTYTISSALGCTKRFLARLYVKNMEGAPIKIDGPNLSDGVVINIF